MNAAESYYFGTYGQAGHYWWTRQGRKSSIDGPGPIDGIYVPKSHRSQGDAAFVTLKGGWTVLAFHNYVDDKRSGSNGAFISHAQTFEQAVELFQSHYQDIASRIGRLNLVEKRTA